MNRTALFTFASLALVSTEAPATECRTLSMILASSPGSHPMYTMRLPDHRGEKCWRADGRRGDPPAYVPKHVRMVGRGLTAPPPNVRGYVPYVVVPPADSWEYRPLTIFDETFLYYGHLPRGVQ